MIQKEEKTLICNIAHSSPMTIEEQAQRLGVNSSTYYRYVNIKDWTPFPSFLRIPFMKLHKNFEPLRKEAEGLGCALIKEPVAIKTQSDLLEAQIQLQLEFSSYSKATLQFFNSHKTTEEELISLLHKSNLLIAGLIGMRERVKRDTRQTNLLGDE